MIAVALPDETLEARIVYASGLATLDFDILSLWSTRPDGTCRCPKGTACDQKPGKHPIASNGGWGETRDPERIRTLLSAASQPNYGVIPPPGCFAWDVDGDVGGRLAELEAKHGPLPATYGHLTPNGEHRFYRWPARIDRPPGGNLFGIVTRWANGEKGRGYTVGPYSSVGAKVYRPLGDPHDIAELPEAWARAAGASQPRLRIAGAPEEVTAGHRHDWLRDRARHYAGVVRDPDALRAAILAENAKLPEPKTDAEVDRAIGDVLRKFGPDASSPPTTPIRAVLDWAGILADPPTPVRLIGGTVPEVGVSVVAGAPKSGKTLWLAQFMLESGLPALLVIEEGSRAAISYRLRRQAEALGIDNPPVHLLHRQRIRLDDRTSVAELGRIAADLGVRLIGCDPLNRLHNADENKPTQMTPVMDALAELAYDGERAVVAVHHVNKPSAERRGDAWDRMRGASSIRSGTDANLILDGDRGTYRKLIAEYRDAEPLTEHLELDRTALIFRPAEEPVAPAKIDPLELRLFVEERVQVTSAEVMERFGVTRNTAITALRALGCDEFEGVRRRITFSLATRQ